MKIKGMRIFAVTALWVLGSLTATSFALAQSQAPSPAAQEAGALFQAQKWAEAVKAYEALTKAEPTNGQAWFRLGASNLSLNKGERAIESLLKAVEILQGPMAMYTLGSAYAAAGNKDKAFEWLNRAAGGGFGQLNRVQNDPTLASVRADPRFKAFADSVELNARPCRTGEARQLDFWVGEWDVQIGGQSVGSNIVERLEDGCLIMENWKGRGSTSGKSMNFYSPVLKKWRQTYMSNTQVVWEMSGEYKDGAMRYEGEVLSPRGRTLTRVVFYNVSPDRVRHTEDDSSDGGKTWTTVWDAMYVRKKPATP